MAHKRGGDMAHTDADLTDERQMPG
jgi:hypothetical protein